MKKVILILLLVCVKTILHAQSIEQTLVQISELKLEIESNALIVNAKIEGLKNNNPIFAEQDAFESDAEYLGRMSTAMPALDRLRKEHLGDKWKKMSILRGRMFETSDVIISLDVKQYDANTEKWPIYYPIIYMTYMFIPWLFFKNKFIGLLAFGLITGSFIFGKINTTNIHLNFKQWESKWCILATIFPLIYLILTSLRK